MRDGRRWKYAEYKSTLSEIMDVESDEEIYQGSPPYPTSPAVYSPFIWMLSVRPVRQLTHFSPLSLLFQPDTRLFCHHGPNCHMNQEHHEMYSHDLPIFDSVITPENPQVLIPQILLLLIDREFLVFRKPGR